MFNIDAARFEKQTGLTLSRHAWRRMNKRGITQEMANAVIRHGRCVHVRGAMIYAIGRKEIAQGKLRGVDLSELNGIQVVCSPKAGVVMTMYRNQDFRGLRPTRRRAYKQAA